MIEPMRPSVWRRASRNTARNVSAVRIASGEYQGWPPRMVRGFGRLDPNQRPTFYPIRPTAPACRAGADHNIVEIIYPALSSNHVPLFCCESQL